MNFYNITNTKTKENYKKEFKNETDARHWVINTLDMSLDWSIDYDYSLNTPF
jgi:hypothetical protein